MASIDKRKVFYSSRVAISVALLAVVVYRIVGPELGSFSHAVLCVLPVVVGNTDFHVGKTLQKATNYIAGTTVGGLLGFGLHRFSHNSIEKENYALIFLAIFALIMLGAYLQFTDWVNEYEINVIAFLVAVGGVLLSPQAPNWLADRFLKKAAAYVSSFAFIVLSTFAPPFWAGVEIHDRIRKHIDILASIFKELVNEDLGEKDFQDLSSSKSFQDLIDSKEKENYLIKLMGWELPWRHLRKQYKKIGDQIRRCTFTIQSLFGSTYLTSNDSAQSLHFTPQLRETCREICSELAEVLTQLSVSTKNKTGPTASMGMHFENASAKISELNKVLEAKISTTYITYHLAQSVNIIKELADSIEELACSMPCKNFGLKITISITLEIPQLSISATQQKVASITNQLVSLIKKLISRFSAWVKKFKMKPLSVLNGPNTVQPPINTVPPEEVDLPEHVAVDIEPPLSPV